MRNGYRRPPAPGDGDYIYIHNYIYIIIYIYIILYIHIWLVVSIIFYLPFHIWDVILPIDELIFFRGVETNQI